ncbi:ExbD/TolR family protein [Amphibiibacter pelophylacis]|uniref:Biopolymer transporter ExbD n=1 Tax=Amphibiibacter pelophylacis TaxID=1799477 RepID=A0ACC6P0V3_9BURK
MAFGSLDSSNRNAPVTEINMVPLIDVLLVLLVIFMVTAPLLTHAVKLDLPKASSAPAAPKPDTLHISLDAAGQRYWNRQPVSEAEMTQRLRQTAAQGEPLPQILLYADATVDYGDIVKTLSDITGAGLSQIGFVSQPDALPPDAASAAAPVQASTPPVTR